MSEKSSCPPRPAKRPPVPPHPHLLPGMKPGDLYFDGQYWCAPNPAGDGPQQETGEIDLRQKLDARIFSESNRPKEPKPRFILARVPVCTPGNITSICAQVKAGKSAFLGAAMASTFATAEKSDCLGWSSENRSSLALVHFDTEQSTFDHWQLIDRARRRAKASKIPNWLRSYCLTGFSHNEIRKAIPLLLDEAAQKFGGVHSLILDGVADAIGDVNDAAQANEFVSEIHALAIQYDCPIIGVIHLNPGSDSKTRGHLGSQLERKAEGNLKLEKNEDVTEVFSERQRRAPIPKGSGPCFAWSDEAHMHVSVENPTEAKAEAKTEAKRDAMRQDAWAIFAKGKKAYAHKEITGLLAHKFNLQPSGARRRLEHWVKNEVVIKNDSGFYVISQ